MARLGHASCARAPFDAHAIPSASASAAKCFIEFSFWLSEPDKQVPCRCANLWNREPLASAATSHAQALQPVGGGRRSPFRLEPGADESRRRRREYRKIGSGTAPAWSLLKPCHTVARKEVTGCRSAGRALCGAVAPC